ncbi:MAG: ligand-binding protein SH3 [Candidatus Kerfeldbacteria bacterium CG15_BIG_FIL_POST_REV_8_21_14_020_45_12]|uniref:Ligand-binding protein SH3 n=1 Tax=Candidatus Kerfeldbacteria bacterium CG15_BIG_FIL_POST_REV_8_21_14_020_45_12 TaxID=2014247 RepID=A0A2M7H3U2_9BACT|nr:MAG: ligand-binding protein SH3 [Candidatus Kerfeldbacteria bacterium CG15_BIG_FIL_POST_REV_8_21_14_020_45_12]PJA94024.1 MAG: ligand-binding protein SH3 [Candidatus Kerfeldbacteria bacterium CG_4_9_14_3_um_filter_45_8]
MTGINFVQWFVNFPPELATGIIAMLPIAELRGAIPAGLVMGLSWQQAAFYAVIGNLIPVVIIVYVIEPVSNFLRQRVPIFDRFFTWLFARTREKFYEKHAKWGDFALVVFVAIPLPVTGAWTGALASWLFGIAPKRALPLISIGVILAAIIVTALSVGVVSLF